MGVVQSRHVARLPRALLEILNTPAALPVRRRNFWMFCCSGAVHSGRTEQWVPFCTSDQ